MVSVAPIIRRLTAERGLFVLVGQNVNLIYGGSAPNAPLLTWTSDASTAYPVADIYLDETIATGDSIQSQIQVSGGSWTSPVFNITHVIASGEAASGDAVLTQGPLATGTYDWRVRVMRASDGAASVWSNVETKTIAVHDESGDTQQAKDFFARVRSAGISIDKTHGDAVAAFINGVVADGIWSKFDALYLSATQSLTLGRLNLVSANYSLANFGGDPIFTADKGFKSTNSPQQQTSGFTPSTASGQWALNSAHFMIWPLETGASTSGDIGTLSVTGGGGYAYFKSQPAGTSWVISINDRGQRATESTATGAGCYVASRTSSAGFNYYWNNTVFGTIAQPSSSLPSSNIYVGALNGNGWGNKTIAAASFGAGLTSTEAAALYARLRTYMTTMGVP
ncbi:hypothetical protein CWS35_24680 [Bradyrhizobium sp. SK17]|nr:hypothetical protein CWS35_24680 [Bradyrhizobium sp. SK17]